MIKFELIVTPEIAAPFQNKQVCDVQEYHITHAIHGKMASWNGSVNDEYFHIIFVKGMLIVSVAERECQLSKTGYIINYAMSESLTNALSFNNKESVESIEAKYNYEHIYEPKEQSEINFDDIMAALKWCYKDENVKIDYDMLMN